MGEISLMFLSLVIKVRLYPNHSTGLIADRYRHRAIEVACYGTEYF